MNGIANTYEVHSPVLGLRLYSIKSDGYWRIRLNAEEAEKFFLLVAPYIPPSMQYKLPQRYRGHAGWLPNLESEYRPILVEQTITEIQYVTKPYGTNSNVKYDLETRTHNFFANCALVHNSNTRASYQDGKFWMGSHNYWRKADPTSLYWKVMDRNPWLKRLCKQNPDCVVYNATVADTLYFRVFDIMKGGYRRVATAARLGGLF